MDERSEVVRSRLVAQLLIIDGQLTDSERTFLFSFMDGLELTEEERDHVIGSVNVDDSVEDILAALDPDLRATVLQDLRSAAESDGETAPGEVDIIERVTAALEENSA